MKTTRIVAMVLLLAGSLAWEAPAQLAITEVMAESSRPVGSSSLKEPDYWELTNFGDTPVNLHGWSFRDNNSTKLNTYVFNNLSIGPEESVIFFKSNVVVPTVESFKSWWGVENLPENLQVRPWGEVGNNTEVGGFDGDFGDQVWLFDSNRVLVDMVTFDKSIPGHSFTYSDTGEFGSYSVAGVNHAFRAGSTTNDIGSPGTNHGPVELMIRTHPTNQVVDRCGRAEFRVFATGIPRPRYQWMSNGIAIPGEIASTLVIPDLEPSHAAEYRVVLNNGSMEITSETATLTVSTNLSAPRVVLAPEDATVFPGQTATFLSEIRGYPCVQYQWHSNGVAIPGATQRSLAISIPSNPADVATASNRYSVTAWNEMGSTNLSAVLVVARRPCLRITEIMTAPNNGGLFGPKNWFELTNCDTNTVDLRNYRFRDSASISVASRITNSLFIRPGESIVFVEAMSPEQFKQWWGASQLPPDLQIVTWGGWGLSIPGDDIIYIWNPGATDPGDPVANASRAAANTGFSQLSLDATTCNLTDGCFGQFYDESVEGERGAFRAAEGGDIGSPGYAAFPRVLALSRTNLDVSVRCLVEPGKTYRLLAKDALSEGGWTPVSTPMPAENNWVITISDPWAPTVPSRFYRIEELP